MIAMKDDATSLILIYGVSISGLALCSYFLFRLVPHLQRYFLKMTRLQQPKHAGVQLHKHCHRVAAAGHEQ